MRARKKNLGLAIIPEIHADLAEIAKAEGRSMSNMAQRLLREAIDRRRAEREPDQRAA